MLPLLQAEVVPPGWVTYDPVWNSAIKSHADCGLALIAFELLMFWRVPPGLVVLITAVGGALIATVA